MDMGKAADVVKRENSRVAKLIGINKAARNEHALKPAGTTSSLGQHHQVFMLA